MKIGVIIAVVVLALFGGVFTWWIAGGASDGATVIGESSRLEPSATGPHPKVVVDESTFDFGRMVLGGSDRHTFLIKNEGEAVLQLSEPQMTCQCTVAKAAPETIAPGETGEITLEWKPTSATDTFNKGATIRTNDPDTPEITLAILGIVDQPVVTEPVGAWQVGDISGKEDISVTGYVYSRVLDGFEVTSWESENELLDVTITPMSAEALKERDATSGAQIEATLEPSIPVGKFETEFLVKTNAKEKELQEVTIQLEGTRLGPIQILPTPGTHWNPKAMAVDLGRFNASEGAEAAVFLFVGGMPEGETFQVKSVESDIDGITATLEHEESAPQAARQRYQLTFKAAAGIAPQTRRSKDSANIVLKTNHPEAKEMKFFVQFIAEP